MYGSFTVELLHGLQFVWVVERESGSEKESEEMGFFLSFLGFW